MRALKQEIIDEMRTCRSRHPCPFMHKTTTEERVLHSIYTTIAIYAIKIGHFEGTQTRNH